MVGFGKRLRELRGTTKQTDAAQELGINYSTYAMYEVDRREPNFETLVSIANHYSVTTDYLLGVSDCKSPDIEEQAICKKTKLTQNALESIMDEKFQKFDDRPYHKIDVLNLLLENSVFHGSLAAVSDCLFFSLSSWKKSAEGTENINGNYKVFLTGKFAAEFYKTKALEFMNETIKFLMIKAEENHGKA